VVKFNHLKEMKKTEIKKEYVKLRDTFEFEVINIFEFDWQSLNDKENDEMVSKIFGLCFFNFDENQLNNYRENNISEFEMYFDNYIEQSFLPIKDRLIWNKFRTPILKLNARISSSNPRVNYFSFKDFQQVGRFDPEYHKAMNRNQVSSGYVEYVINPGLMNFDGVVLVQAQVRIRI